MIQVERHGDGVVLPVRALPGARKTEIRGEQNGALKIAVTQVAEKGKANKALILVITKQLGLRKSQVELISGSTSATKRFLIKDISVAELVNKVARFVNPVD